MIDELIGNQLEVILEKKMSKLPVKEVGDIFIDKVEIDTQRGVDPAGQPYIPYAYSTANRKGYTQPDMRDKSRSIETVDTLYQQANETRIGFEGNAGYGRTSKPASEIFYYHQEGLSGNGRAGEKTGKVRKVFLEEEDMTSAGAVEAIERVEILLEEYFNEQ